MEAGGNGQCVMAADVKGRLADELGSAAVCYLRPGQIQRPVCTPSGPQDFWSQIYTSYALVPSFGMPVYYESRISSTILASLITCVPIIAEQKLLDTYTFIKWVTGSGPGARRRALLPLELKACILVPEEGVGRRFAFTLPMGLLFSLFHCWHGYRA